LLRRVAVEFAFIGTVLLGTLFRDEGTVLWSWGWLQITTAGLNILGSVALKAFLSLLMLNILILTTSIPSLLHALADLKVPPLLVAILSSMYRYIAVLIDEFDSMRRAALSRNLMASKQWQRLVIGNMIGSLFIRTYERGDRIHQAMLSRGYTGLLPVTQDYKMSMIDYLSIFLTILIVLLGQFIYLR
jgi:cobalt/nickel transport system permease protein